MESLLRMRLLEPVLVSVFERQIPILFVTRAMLLEIFLGHHVQSRRRGQFCFAWRLLSRFLADPIRLPFLRCAAVLCAMRIERRNAAHDKRRDGHNHKEPNGLEFSGHEFDVANHTRFLRTRPMSCSSPPEMPPQFPT
jgi:hypothetical protein